MMASSFSARVLYTRSRSTILVYVESLRHCRDDPATAGNMGRGGNGNSTGRWMTRVVVQPASVSRASASSHLPAVIVQVLAGLRVRCRRMLCGLLCLLGGLPGSLIR